LLVLAVFVLGVWVGVRAANATSDRSTLAERTYVVRQGDTLWGLAERGYPQCGDVRTVVHEIQQRNGLRGAALRPGQVLRLPAIEP
jgi:nucleoid-associated protein YgaU